MCKCIYGLEPDCTFPELDECEQVCENEGTLDLTNCKCNCKPNYTGKSCQYDVLACQNFKCVNGKIQIIDDECYCYCDEGWTGYACDIEAPDPYIPPYKYKAEGLESMINLCPTHIRGDCETGGNPTITAIITLSHSSSAIFANVKFEVYEPNSDYTTAILNETRVVWDDVPTGREIVGFNSTSTSFRVQYTDVDHSYEYINGRIDPQPDGTAHIGITVDHLLIMGDTGGDDVCGCRRDHDSSIDVYFQDRYILLRII